MLIGLKYSIFAAVIFSSVPAASQTEQKTLYNFGDWRIDRIESNRSFVMVGAGEIKGDTRNFLGFRYFHIQCFEESNALSVMIPYDRKPERRMPLKALTISVWSDRNDPIDLLFLALNDFSLVAMTGPTKESDAAARSFISVLEQSKQRFSYSLGEKSVHFDVTDFRPAWKKLRQLCMQTR